MFSEGEDKEFMANMCFDRNEEGERAGEKECLCLPGDAGGVVKRLKFSEFSLTAGI